MAHPIIVPVTTQGVSWQSLRKGIRDCIKSVAPLAVVYSSWPLKMDVNTTVNLLRSQADGNKVHAWIIGINSAEPFDTKTGGYNLQWTVNVRIWGFLGYSAVHDDSIQNVLEEEARKVSQVLYINRKHLGLEDTSALKDVGYATWEDIDVNAFPSGDDVHVAQGNLEVTLSEGFVLP